MVNSSIKSGVRIKLVVGKQQLTNKYVYDNATMQQVVTTGQALNGREPIQVALVLKNESTIKQSTVRLVNTHTQQVEDTYELKPTERVQLRLVDVGVAIALHAQGRGYIEFVGDVI